VQQRLQAELTRQVLNRTGQRIDLLVRRDLSPRAAILTTPIPCPDRRSVARQGRCCATACALATSPD
jgi:hypothetical protein